ncbi:MAG: SDR family NAD(P)-dependent oxidoreductase [Myxococcales bacterium]|nr:SDR family NAD(P)-dependent oxidoreductase [Myxococcales bacterium]
MRDLQNRTALVTGASRGLGVYIARALAAEGMNLILVARSAEGLERVADELRATGCKVQCIPTDLADREAVQVLAEQAEAESDGVDVLVNNAGAEYAMPFDQIPVERLDEAVEVNLRAPMVLARLLLPKMIARGRGHIVNISAANGLFGTPYSEPLCATKHGMVGLSRGLRATAKSEGYPVGCSAICSGFVTESGMYDDLSQEFGIRAPWTLGTSRPESVARAVVRAVKRDLPEVFVNPIPLRPVAVLAALLPRLTTWLVLRLGVAKVFGPVAKTRAAASSAGES